MYGVCQQPGVWIAEMRICLRNSGRVRAPAPNVRPRLHPHAPLPRLGGRTCDVRPPPGMSSAVLGVGGGSWRSQRIRDGSYQKVIRSVAVPSSLYGLLDARPSEEGGRGHLGQFQRHMVVDGVNHLVGRSSGGRMRG